jgi:stage II sporulation protein AA (anti-sigma F factor antagonist)
VEIQRIKSGNALELRLAGRLDEHGAQQFDSALAAALAGGDHHLRLDLGEISYVSSSGIGVLVRYQQRLKQLGGALAISAVSTPVRRVLEMARLGVLLEPQPAVPEPGPPTPIAPPPEIRIEPPRLEVLPLESGATLRLTARGNPDLLAGRLFDEKDARPLRPPASGFALGLGAFGRDFEACRHRFGEFLALAGTAVYHPCDGSNVPDQLPASADLLTLYSLICEGSFSHRARFAASGPGAAVSLEDLVGACLDATGAAGWAGMVFLAEAPATSGATPLAFLAGGIAARASNAEVAALLHPEGWSRYSTGRFHAARFGRALPALAADVTACCRAIFEAGALRDVVVPRPDTTHFTRGACWMGPIAGIKTERS